MRKRILALLMAAVLLGGLLVSCVQFQGSVKLEESTRDPIPSAATQQEALSIEPIVLVHVALPNYIGADIEQTETLLQQNLFEYEITYEYSDTVEKGKIIRSNEDENLKDGKIYIPIEDKVELVVSKGEDPKMYCFVTFDDGPSKYGTYEVLEILARHNAVATFFVIGKNMSNYPDQIRAIEAAGCLIGCHSYTHDMPTLYKNVTNFEDEITRWMDKYEEVTGKPYTTNLFRFPGGSGVPKREPYNNRVQLINRAHEFGFRIFDWTALNNDRALWDKPDDMSVEDYLRQTFLSTTNSAVKKNRPMLLLFHETSAETRGMLDWMLNYLEELGYTYATLDKFDGEYIY
ncbi:MAG: polysaccharide deacetylase family protein [Clostridia bacterium]|nr:polysaccharide deacetylase family protein [Clostridia bacterium]